MNTMLPFSADEALTFLPETLELPSASVLPPWKIMIVDDEPGVHAATRLALRDIQFRGRGLCFISAHSGTEALALFQEHPDTAMVLLDVVMESDDAGLIAARKIRECGFNLVRIVLRTGHPGYAPEREVVVNYDIHDYKEKSSLDFSKLFSCLISALRAYDDLVAIEQHRRGLLSVLEAVSWFDFRSLQRYLSRMLSELSSLANIEVDQLLLAVRSPHHPSPQNRFTTLIDGLADAPLNLSEQAYIDASLDARSALNTTTGATFFVHAFGIDLVLFTRDTSALENADRVLLELFLNKVAQAVDNHHTFTQILCERDSLVRSAVGTDEHWGGHGNDEIMSMQKLTREIAAHLQQGLDFPEQIDDWFVFSIGTASAFHDLGVQALPHQLFEKPGALSAEERTAMEQHTQHGVELLRSKLGDMKSSRLFKMSRDVILQHHERYDGSGYPAHLQGEAITLPARIVAVADTYVAMTSTRPYRPAHSVEDALSHIRKGRGRLYDPRVVDAFLDVIAPQG